MKKPVSCLCHGRNHCRFAHRYACKRTAWRHPRLAAPDRDGARPLRSGSWAIRRLWQLRMGDTAFLGRPWLANPPGASLRLIRDYGEIERLLATIDLEWRPSK